ncbi:MAG: helix-turn-helix domain-containing protein [Sphingorhabdus sp.]
MARGLEGKSVKSARRVLEVLEYFSTGAAEVTVMEMSRALNYPQSSTSELLSCLVTLGYLNHDRHRRTFRPTVRVAAIGSAVRPNVFRRDALLDVIDDVHEETGAIVVVAMAQRGVLHHVHVAGCIHSGGLRAPGSILHSAMGQALLAATTDSEVRALIHRLNAEAQPGDTVSPSDYLADLARVQECGYALAPAFDGIMLATLVPYAQPDPLAIGVVTPGQHSLATDEVLLACLGSAFRRHLAPSAPIRQEAQIALTAQT